MNRAAVVFGFLIAVRGTVAEPVVDVLGADIARFTALLKSPSIERRIEAVQGLGHLKYWPADDAIAAQLGEQPAFSASVTVLRREALQALGRLGTARSVPVLASCLAAGDWEMRENARLALLEMTAHDCADCTVEQWTNWWSRTTLAQKQQDLLVIASRARGAAPAITVQRSAPQPGPMRRGRRARTLPASLQPPAHPERREALRALRHLADASLEPALLSLLAAPQTPALDPDERAFICDALERVGSTNAISVLAMQRTDAAAWALGRIGGPQALQALLGFPPTLPALLALDRLQSTNAAALLPFLVQNMAQITYRGQPDDVMNDELQPIQRVGINLIRRTGLAPLLIEAVLQELENTAKPPIAHGPPPQVPEGWKPFLAQMRSELRPGFIREDGVTTSQPLVTVCYLAADPLLARRLIPLLAHPAVVVRVYVALALGRLHAAEAMEPVARIINAGYAFSDSTALASGKHFDQSQAVRWKGFLCMALGRMGGEPARLELEGFLADPARPRDIRYSSAVGLRFIGSEKSLPVLKRAAAQDVIWMVRDEARRASEQIELLATEAKQ